MKKEFVIMIGLAVVVVAAGLFLALKAGNNKPVTTSNSSTSLLGEEFPNLGQQHIDIGTEHIAYNSNPPTSGPHYIQPANWGVYETTLPDEQLVHNLEHGGIWISYHGVDTETKNNLERIGRSNPGRVVVEPRDQDDTKIAVASWTRLLKLDSFDEQKILDFINSNTNKSPEPLAK